jgi:hypothetical protein
MFGYKLETTSVISVNVLDTQPEKILHDDLHPCPGCTHSLEHVETCPTNVLNTKESSKAYTKSAHHGPVDDSPLDTVVPEVPKGPVTDKDVFDATRFLTADSLELKDFAIKYLRGKVTELEEEIEDLKDLLESGTNYRR